MRWKRQLDQSRNGMRQTPSSTAAPSVAVIQCCIRGGDLNNVNASRRVLPHGIGQGIALPCRVGAGSNPAAATYRGATHARGPALDVLKQIIGSHCLWCRRSMSATQAVLKDALVERSKAVAQGAIPKGRGFEPHSRHAARSLVRPGQKTKVAPAACRVHDKAFSKHTRLSRRFGRAV